MKKLLFVSALCSMAALANADTTTQLRSDGTALSGLCVAAVSSGKTFTHLAREMGLSGLQQNELTCNGMPVQAFIAHYRRMAGKASEGSYTFSISDESDLSRLCLAAVKSEEEYDKVKSELFGNARGLDDQVMCNDMPIRDFARKYRAHNLTASIQ